jgi:fatty-acyl-CoA synthase
VRTIAELIRSRAADDRVALRFEGAEWTWREVIQEAADRAAALGSVTPSGGRRQVHVGVMLPNLPDFVFWLLAAGLSGAVMVGINPTRRGAELAQDIRHTDCDLLVTDEEHLPLLAGLDVGIPSRRILDIGSRQYADFVASHRGAGLLPARPEPGDTMLLVFSSGSTGRPKAVICSQGRLMRVTEVLTPRLSLRPDSVAYMSMPLFHLNAIVTNLTPVMLVGARMVIVRRFSASGFVRDLHTHGITYANYVGRSMTYILTTKQDPRDRHSTLEVAYGAEASASDIARFSQRFGCEVREAYGSSEGVLSIAPVPDTPPGSLGVPARGYEIKVLDDSGVECPPARFDGNGTLLNPEEAIGEIVGVGRARFFEGYYRNPEAEAERIRGDDYWSGDLGYRDALGNFYFAGRSSDWLRVDSENFSADPVERILLRHDAITAALVYGVPDPQSGDNVMCAVELAPGQTLDPAEFARFLDRQADLGTKWRPRFVRVISAVPETATGKVSKIPLRTVAWDTDDPVWWAPPRSTSYHRLTEEDRAELRREFAAHGRENLLPRPAGQDTGRPERIVP